MQANIENHCNNSFIKCGRRAEHFQVVGKAVTYVHSEESGTYSGPVSSSSGEGMSGPLVRSKSRTGICSGPVCHSGTLEFSPVVSSELSDI